MQLRRPTLTDKAEILAMLAEFRQQQSAMDGFVGDVDFVYEKWLSQNAQTEQGENLPTGFVPAVQYVSFNERGKAIGFLHLRLQLNAFLLEKGGHIGYSIRPTARGNGFAKQQLKLGLAEAAKQGISRVLITCHQENCASRQTILANGGKLDDVRNGIERYWIEN